MNQDFKKMKERLFSCSLLLSLMLTGCADASYGVGDHPIKYEDGKVTGTVDYEDIEKSIKIVTFSQDEAIFTKPVFILNHVYSNSTSSIRYVDMETGTVLIDQSTNQLNNEVTYDAGRGLVVLNEKSFEPYLFTEDNIKLKYDINELIGFYHEKVEPTLEANHVIAEAIVK